MCSMGSGEYEEYADHRQSRFPQAYEDRAPSLLDPFIQDCGPQHPCGLLKSEREDS